MPKGRSNILQRILQQPLVLAVFCAFYAVLSVGPALASASPEFPVLVVSAEKHEPGGRPPAAEVMASALAKADLTVLRAASGDEALGIARANKTLGAVLLDVDSLAPRPAEALRLVDRLRALLPDLPVFVLTGRLAASDLSAETLRGIAGFVRKDQDTPAFIAGTIRTAAQEYREHSLPVFFKALARYVDDSKYAWATPGHTGGTGFLASVPGSAFHEFFGENIFRADVSSSMAELGSILEHGGPAGEAEKNAAMIFGADHTFFVLNGTSTSNKMVWHGRVSPGDIVLVDRNCHKSLMHAIIMTRAIPVFLTPTRNPLGIIGPISLAQFDPARLRQAIAASALVKDPTKPVRIFVLTNTTYDGLAYNARAIKDRMAGFVENIHFDEAWYGYARFSPVYEGRYAMSVAGGGKADPVVFATQSSHKVLAAFSQGSMIHVRTGGKTAFDPEIFNESVLMHSSTSPFYPMFASLDVAAKMMEGAGGRRIMNEALAEAVSFRRKLAAMRSAAKAPGWWFGVWQPEAIGKGGGKGDGGLTTSPESWVLKPGDAWHGFSGLVQGEVMLDPLKVTILTPGMDSTGVMHTRGIPAGVVSEYLQENGVIPEKVGYYSFLMLFTPGVTEGKSGTLLAKLAAFHDLYERNAPLAEVLPTLVARYPGAYQGQGLRELCDAMHAFLVKNAISKQVVDIYETLPEQRMLPADAYDLVMRGELEEVPVNALEGRTVLTMLVPYPPGIPLVMPGERLTDKNRAVLSYFAMAQEMENLFPGFETEIHGVKTRIAKDGRKEILVRCARR